MKKPHEEITRSQFDDWLRRMDPDLNLKWIEVPPAQEPPDWYLVANGTRHSVEATTVVPIVQTGTGDYPEPSVSSFIHDLVAAIQANATEEGILDGAYALAICPLPNTRPIRRWLEDKVLDFIRSNQGLPRTDFHSFGYLRNTELSIQKLHSEHALLAELISFETKSGQDIRDELRVELALAINRKISSLATVPTPWTLLILVGFFLADDADWLAAAMNIPGKERFHRIFRIKLGHDPIDLGGTATGELLYRLPA